MALLHTSLKLKLARDNHSCLGSISPPPRACVACSWQPGCLALSPTAANSTCLGEHCTGVRQLQQYRPACDCVFREDQSPRTSLCVPRGSKKAGAASSLRTFVDSELQPPAFAGCSQRVKPHPRRRRHVSWLLARLVALVMFRDWLWLVPPFLLSYLCSLCFPRWPGYGKKEMERFGYAHSAYCPIHLLRQCVGFGCSSVARPTFANRE